MKKAIKLKKINIDKIYKLPKKVAFCKTCVISNQRPKIDFDEKGICAACRYFEYKKTISFKKREEELKKILDKNRSKNSSYDCVVPSSGGKDSAYVAHELKTKYGMNPLTVTWSPLVYTEIGFKNLIGFNKAGFDVILGMMRGDTTRRLCRDATIEMGDPFQPFIYGQALFPMKIAAEYGIKLVFVGENAQAEYGGPKNSWNKSHISISEYEKFWFSNYAVKYWLNKGYSLQELQMIDTSNLKKFSNVKKYFYGYFRNWSNHSNYYYAKKYTNFQPNPERTEGTFTKYSSIDDKLDTFHHWFSLLKFGISRCTANASREVREGFRTRKEAVSLVKRYDSEFPKKYFKDFLEYTNLTKEEFFTIADSWRNKKLWKKTNNKWKLTTKII